MSESNQHSSKANQRRNTAIIGLVVVFVIALLVNFLVGKMSFRADLTEYKTYTLSDGTENILEKLDTPVEVRFYVTDDGKVMSAPVFVASKTCSTSSCVPLLQRKSNSPMKMVNS